MSGAVICFLSWPLFEMFRKYLLFLSPTSYQRLLLRMMQPLVLTWIILSSFFLTEISFSYMGLEKLRFYCRLCRVFNCCSNSFSSGLRVLAAALCFANEIVKARNSIFIISHRRPLSFRYEYLILNSGIFFSGDSVNFSSVRRELLNFQKPGPRYDWVVVSSIVTAEWSEIVVSVMFVSVKLLIRLFDT